MAVRKESHQTTITRPLWTTGEPRMGSHTADPKVARIFTVGRRDSFVLCSFQSWLCSLKGSPGGSSGMETSQLLRGLPRLCAAATPSVRTQTSPPEEDVNVRTHTHCISGTQHPEDNS